MNALNSNLSRTNRALAILIDSGVYPSTIPHDPLGARLGPAPDETTLTPWIG